MRPAPLQQQPQQHKQQPANQQQQQQPVNLQFQRGPSSPRKERLHGHGGLSAKLGAFFNKLTLDSETSPRLKSSKGSTPTPIGSPRSPASPTHRHQQQQQQQHQHQEPFPKSPSIMSFQLSASPSAVDDDARRVHERSFSDAPKSPQLARISAAVETEPRTVHHRVTVSHCQAPPLGIGSRQHLARLEQESVRKPSQGSHLSTTASTTTAGYASTDSSHSESDSGASSHKPSSNRSSDRSSGASTLANRKRSFTHLGLSMESLSAEHAKSPLSAASSARSPQLRRTKPAANISSLQAKLVSPGAISEGMARLAAPTNSLGLVLQTSSAVLASKQKQKPMPLPAPIRTQRHHNSFSVVAKEPRSPTASSRVHNGLSSIVDSRNAMSPTAKSAAPGTLAFPPMPSEACQAAMLSGSTSSLQLSLAAEQAEQQRRAQPTPPHQITRALSDSTMDKTIAAMVVVATAAYDYTSSIKGDLEFKKGERIVIQSKINDDWWFGSILPEAGRGSTGRSGMFPRSHVAFI
ncbi:hypothetical protein H4R99_005973 [Coemansia sp. RSA 1722]|nr:hypothetical protein H4R99_005973 [Coemansia sp. RSA 1722]